MLKISTNFSFSTEEETHIAHARTLQDHCQFSQAQAYLEKLDFPDLHKQLYIKSLILKGLIKAGNNLEALKMIKTVLDAKHDFTGSEPMQYLHYKLHYQKAKIHKGLHGFTDCVAECSELINKLSEAIKTEAKPEPWWKFCVKAIYVKSCLYARYSEIKLPREYMTTLALIAIEQMTTKLAEGDAQQNYYKYEYRLMWAKIRSKLYFVKESNRLYGELIHDTLKTYGMYDFPEMPTQENREEQTAETLAKVLSEQLEYKEKTAMDVDYAKIKKIEDTRAIKQVCGVIYSWSKLLLIRK